ncbi:hypothetical protein B0H10DRAFT_2304811 [Mycena sp. CBHHK59/15]|nr:hypothetical protein B0H10DRAFT_2304811 [Mycena sp. CBHHK59/15]
MPRARCSRADETTVSECRLQENGAGRRKIAKNEREEWGSEEEAAGASGCLFGEAVGLGTKHRVASTSRSLSSGRRFEVGSGATRRREVTNERYLNIRPEATQIRTCFRMKMDISESACKTWASSAFLSSKCGASASERRVFRLVRDPDGSEKFRNWYMSALRASGVGRLRDRGSTGVFRSPEKMADNIGEICVTWYMDVLRRPEASRRRGRGAVTGFGPGGSSDVFPRACTCVNQISQCLSPPAPIRCTARDHARGRGWKIGVRKDLIQLQASAIHNVEGYATHLLSASILDNPRQAN